MAIVRLQHEESRPAAAPPISEADFLQEFEQSGLSSPPVDIVSVAEMLGIQISYELMEKDLSGYLEFKSGRWVAGVNILHHVNRQRFTLAHEIAHFVLHTKDRTQFVDETFARRNAKREPIESAADMFAANLLMPEKFLREAIEAGIKKVSELADRFGVSTQAMRIRLEQMGYNVA